MEPLPPVLAAAFEAAAGGGAKRERTQAQLVQAAVRVFSARGVAAATMQEVAQVAGVTAATVYNHFNSKEALLDRVAATLADGLCRAINDSYAGIADGAQRMAIGQRRYIWLAGQCPSWALLLLDVLAGAPQVLAEIQKYPLADLRRGVRQGKFKVPSEAAALDVINGVCTLGMRRVALGLAPAPGHDIACATMVLRALGMPGARAAEVAARPLPEFFA
ncbi:MAG TPA: helix-turn-helix domain-containing protein [Ramlibacter sp.]|nr:helix-turn-helix domain-containing protein [Ramlibacter sp.]